MLCEHCGKSSKLPRSGPDHRRLFAIINAAYDSWPETHSFQPNSVEHLRAWCLMRTGRFTLVPLRKRNLDFTEQILLVSDICQQLDAFPFIDIEAEDVGIKKPHSMRFDRMSQRQFGPLRDAIEDLLCTELGCTVEALAKAEAA